VIGIHFTEEGSTLHPVSNDRPRRRTIHTDNETFHAVLCGDAATVCPSKCLLCPSGKTMAMPAIHLHGENPWKLGLGFLVLTLFFGLGLAHVFRPGSFYRRSGIRKGGEMLTEFK
jgi:hypothetical protein